MDIFYLTIINKVKLNKVIKWMNCLELYENIILIFLIIKIYYKMKKILKIISINKVLKK